MSVFASLNWVMLAAFGVPFLFMTLTTPPDYWSRERDVYFALRRLREWLVKYPGFRFAIVKKEFGKRGMRHYHLVVAGIENIPAAELRKVWTNALRSPVPVRVHLAKPESAQAVARYLSKYVAKVGFEGSAETPKTAAQASERLSVEACAAVSGEESPAFSGVSLSNAHNVGGDGTGQGYTGSRWWYTWGELPEAEVEVLEGMDARKFAARIRRLFRRWRVQSESRHIERGIFKDYGYSVGIGTAHQLARQSVRHRLAWLGKGRGFSIFASPELLDAFLWAATYAEV